MACRFSVRRALRKEGRRPTYRSIEPLTLLILVISEGNVTFTRLLRWAGRGRPQKANGFHEELAKKRCFMYHGICNNCFKNESNSMANAPSRMDDFTIRLHDGRRLQVLKVGPSGGLPIFHCHGNGSSRLEVLTVQSVAEQLGVRLVSLDRPGIGGSDPKAGYQLLDWPADVGEVADQLGIERFAVEGLSGGAPFALACAYAIPHRLTGCALISPATGPFLKQAGSLALRSEVWMLLHLPWLVRALFRLAIRLSGSDEASLDKKLLQAGTRLGEADQQVLSNPEVRKAFAQATAECFRQAADVVQPMGSFTAGRGATRSRKSPLRSCSCGKVSRIGSCHRLPPVCSRKPCRTVRQPFILMKGTCPLL